MASVELWWIPLGAGGHFVKFNGPAYETLRAWRERRPRMALYHSALVVQVPEGRFVIEDAGPIPDSHDASRGVVVEGPVFSRKLGRFRSLRYEVRCWREGIIFDARWAAPPCIVTEDARTARLILALAPQLPVKIWGRDEDHVGDMWNSNSVISWLLSRAGLDAESFSPPSGGRAPGWASGIAAARAQQRGSELDAPHAFTLPLL